MRTFVADAFPEPFLAELAERGHAVFYEPDTTADQLPDQIGDSEVLVVRSTKVSADTLAAGEWLRLVIRAGSGTNTIDCAAATERGIVVCNVPGRNAVAVAELTFGLLLALDRRIVDNAIDLRAGRWNKRRYAQALGIAGRRIGVVGLGWIGLAVAERAAAFDAQVYAVRREDRSAQTLARAERISVRFVDSLAELARTCDVLSFHLPSTEATRGLIGRDLLTHVRSGTIILNTARGDLVDEDALIESMDAKDIRAGLDVYADEPGSSSAEFESKLARHPNVYGTHHIGASTDQAQQEIAGEVLRMVDAFAAGTILHGVNVDAVQRQEPVGAGTGTPT